MSNNQESTSNPYRAPLAEATLVETNIAKSSDPDSIINIAKRTFLDWEKLRLLYLLICGVVTAITAFGMQINFSSFELFGVVLVGGVFANLCYFAAPITETYLSWIGLKAKAVRIAIFAVGTVITCAGAVIVLSEI